MALADDLAAVDADVRKGPRCTVGLALQAMTDADRDALNAALARPDVPTSNIAAVLRANGIDIADATLGRHRKGHCRCPRSATP